MGVDKYGEMMSVGKYSEMNEENVYYTSDHNELVYWLMHPT